MATTPPEIPPTPPLDDLDKQLAGLVRHSRRYVWASIVGVGLLVVVLLGIVVYLLYSQHNASVQNANQITSNQQKSDKRWCATLDLLTSQPVPRPADPSSNPSRVASYLLFTDFSVLKKEFGCKP